MDPRIQKTRAAVLAACRQIVTEDGPSALTMDGVVAASGVAKSTLYRHWATREDLLAEFFTSCAPCFEPLPEGLGFIEALRATLAEVASSFTDESWRRLMPALMILEHQMPELRELNRHVKEEQLDIARQVLDLGIAEGQLRPAVLDDLHATMALLVGPVLMQALLDEPIEAAFLDRCVEQFVAGHRP